MKQKDHENYSSVRTMVVQARKIIKNKTVMIISGKHKGKTLKVVSLDKNGKLKLESLVGLNSQRKVYNILVHHSNVKLTS